MTTSGRLKDRIKQLADMKMDELRSFVHNNGNSEAETIRLSRQDKWTRGDCIVDILENDGLLPESNDVDMPT